MDSFQKHTPDLAPQPTSSDLDGATVKAPEIERLDISALKTESEYHQLVALLKRAYSGEKAAAFAYQGHAKSVSDPAIRTRIEEIERDEWIHRDEVGVMLSILGSKPAEWREVGFGTVGRSLSFLCHFTGFTLPMYFAGRLESSNVEEYLQASQLADALGLEEMAMRLKEMADTEKLHESFFKEILKR